MLKNCLLQPNFIVSFENIAATNLNNWWGLSYYAYLLLRVNSSAVELETKLPVFIQKHYLNSQTGYPKLDMHLQPLVDIHLHSNFDDRTGEMGNLTYLCLFSALAFFVLVIAGINFMNLATACSQQRAKELRVRKAAGGARLRQILVVAQFAISMRFTDYVSRMTSQVF